MKAAFGMILVVLGALWVLFTGGCTLLFVGTGLRSIGGSATAAAGSLTAFLVIGFICVAPGVAMLWLGLRMIRRAPAAPPSSPSGPPT